MDRIPRIALFLTAALGPLAPGWGAEPGSDPNFAVRQALQGELEDFSVPGWDRRTDGWEKSPTTGPFLPEAGPATRGYRDRLVKNGTWTGGPVWHQMGTLALVREGKPQEKLGVNVFFPPGPPRGTLLFVHGYLSHAANFAYTFAFFTARGWTVATLDLPGHGLSTGPRADIDDFSTYGDAVALWLAWVQAQGWPGPQVLAAHSLGSAACLEALRRPGTPIPDKVVFCAPLLRTQLYPLLSFTKVLVGWAVKEVPSTFGWDGYLDGAKTPVHWFEALQGWLDRIGTQGALTLPLTIYSGDNDPVVDWAWNRETYRKLVPGAEYIVLPGKDHLFLSNEGDREAFHKRLWEGLGY